MLSGPGFYSTYEELKQATTDQGSPKKARFYSTYEELKPSAFGFRQRRSEFLQYLWGIETLTNDDDYILEIEPAFLQYLWGIETWYKVILVQIFSKRFYSTYEELKPNKGELHKAFLFEFLQYLWGIETELIKKGFLPALKVFTVPMRNWN